MFDEESNFRLRVACPRLLRTEALRRFEAGFAAPFGTASSRGLR